MTVLEHWFSLPRSFRILVILAVAVACWQAAVVYFKIPTILVPTPWSVIERLYESPAFYFMHAWRTLYETLVGFVLAVILGIALAVLIISSRFLEETIYVLLIAFNGIPKVAIAPLFVVWMGTGLAPKFAISATIAIFVIVIDLVLGLRSVEPEMLDLARSLKGGRFKTLILIRFPHALPNLFAGMKVGVTLALIGSIVGEFVASDYGLGYLIMVAQGAFDTVQIFAAIVLLGVMGMALFFALDFAERLAVPWHVSRRAPDAPERVVAVG
jgi:NitT/TauT family transport system permease protein